MRAGELSTKKVFSKDGKSLGKVHDLQVENNEVKFLYCGSRGFLERLFRSKGGKKIDWNRVKEVTATKIVLKD